MGYYARQTRMEDFGASTRSGDGALATEKDLPTGRRSRSVVEYAAAVATGEPTPGGGSVAATTAAFAAALAEMVCRLTLARPLEVEAETALTDAQRAAAQLRHRFLALAIEDENAYGVYRTAAGLPKSTADEREVRRRELEAALGQAAGVPLRVASGCVELLGSLDAVAALGTKHARADVRTSLRLARAALGSAADMVKANTELMRDRARATQLEREIGALTARGEQTYLTVARALDDNLPEKPTL
ncbi:MAG TPA: cyclodeaminase/cyclohydrolase family protein [Thermomicrobiales bacterium]|jgi:formiminotetrahydrofolate cyclodeaminase